MDTQEKGEEVNGRREETKTEASDGKKGEKPASPPASAGFWELFRFADQLDYVLMAIGTVGAIVHGCSLPLFMRVMAGLINSFGANQNNTEKMMHGVIQYALYYLIVGASVWASSWAEISCWMWTAERQSAKMRIKYLEAALSQDIEFYDTEIRTSDVVLAINTDAVLVQNAIGEKFGNFIHHMAVFVAGFVVGFTSVWRIALMTIVMLPFLTIFGGLSAAVVARLAAKSQKAHSQAGSISEQSIVQIRTVLAYVAESRTIQAYSSILKIAQKLGYKIGLGKGMGIGATYFIVFATYSLLLWYGGISIRHHFANGALVITAISAITMSGQAFMQSVPDVTAFVGGRAAAAKIFRIIDRKPSIDRNNGSGLAFDSVKGQVEFKNVNFSYPSRPDHQVLNNLSLTIPAGKTIALIGSSGSGKSTVVSLIERFYDITSGQVLVDGHDIKTLNLRWLRQQIGLVSQEPALFATTIKENILLGRPEASMVEVEEAARVANAHSFIFKLPDGYDTQVGDKGTQMSGGQKQRIAIARAMLKNPSILLLDEATSALDSESEKLVQEALDRFMIGRTTLVIAHRLSTIRKADQVAVLEHGSLVEIGQHDDLIGMGDKSVYAKLIKLQESAHNNNAPKINARSSKMNSFNSPNSSFVRSPIIALNYSYGLSPSIDASRLSELSTPDIDQSFETAYPNDRHEKLAFKEHTSSFLRLAKMNSPEWPFALIGTICSILCGSVNAIFAYVLSAVIGVYYNPDRAYMKKETAKYCYLLIGLSVSALIFCTLQHFFWDIVGENLTKRVKEKLLATVLKNEMGWFDQEENESSRVAGRLALDATNVRSAIGDRISLIMQNSALMLLASVVAFVLQWRLTLVVVSVLPFIIGATVLQKMFTQGFSGDLEAAHAKGTLLAAEAVANLRIVAAFNSESNMVELFTSNLEIPLRRCFWKGQISGCLYGISQFCLFASNALALWYASWLVKQGMSDFSKSIRVFMILLISGSVAAETLILAPDLVKGGRAMHSVFELLDRKTQIESDDSNTTLISSRLQGEIEFKHVQFAYPSRPDVLVFRDLSFCARPGKTLALVGPSGCGKSSVIALIERFYEPFSGRVSIDRKDIRKYNLKSLRRHIALVPQEPCLFATSIYDNIAYGHDSATEAEVIEAATLANAHKFISSLPDGYKTYAGERGVQLSGGQKQRIAIARAFLKKADIMLLDEATSALDSESESEVQVALDRVCDGNTTIVVAHKIATIKNANVIAVIDKGKIAEQGSHPQLLKNPDGIYARMTQLQISTHGQDVNYVESGSSSTPPTEHQEG